jgi:hypothetical protein
LDNLTSEIILVFLEKLGERYPYASRLVLLGGSALCLLGNPRPTLDIDYLGDDLSDDEFQRTIDQVAAELHLSVDAVTIERFVPIPENAVERHIFYKRFGQVEVYIFDPYTIALRKIDRGFDTDIDDIVFLVQQGQIDLDTLDDYLSKALEQTKEFDLHPVEAKDHLEAIRRRIK